MTANSQKPKFLEFFAGGGMVRQALSPAWECAFANDFSEKKAMSYRKNWGGADLAVKDIQALTTQDLPGHPDLAWGSSPCQDVSLAGSGAGLAGQRSGMFWSFFNLVRGLQSEGRAPKIVTIENVTGLITSNGGKDFAAISEAFASAGYRFGAMIVDAIHWVPQSRPRVFLIATAPGIDVPACVHADKPTSVWHPSSIVREYSRLPEEVKNQWIWWDLGPAPVVRPSIKDVLEVDPPDAPWYDMAKRDAILNMMSGAHREKVDEAVRRTASGGTSEVAGLYKRTRNGVQRAEVRFDGVAGCLRTPNGGSSRQSLLIVENGDIKIRLVSKREAARLMGLPDAYALPEKYNDAYHLAGDGVAVPVVRAIAETIYQPILAHNAQNSIGVEAA